MLNGNMECNYTGKTFRIFVRHCIEHFDGIKNAIIIVIKYIKDCISKKLPFDIKKVDFG